MINNSLILSLTDSLKTVNNSSSYFRETSLGRDYSRKKTRFSKVHINALDMENALSSTKYKFWIRNITIFVEDIFLKIKKYSSSFVISGPIKQAEL